MAGAARGGPRRPAQVITARENRVSIDWHESASDPPSGNARLAVTEARAEAFLRDRFGREAGGVEAVVQGEWSQAYAFSRGDRELIIRFSALVEDFAKDRLAAGYSSPELPIPRVVEIGEAFGGYFAISERARGDYLDALDERRMRELLPALFRALDTARLADLSASRGYGGWRADGTAPHATWRDALLEVAEDRPTDRIRGWRARLAQSPTGLGPFEEAFERFRCLLAYAPADRHLIHSDLLNHNALVAGDRFTAVFDWGCSMYGDFLYDVAWFSFWSDWFPAWRGIDFVAEAARHYQSIGLDVPGFECRVRCYELHIGLAHFAYNAFKGRWDDLESVTSKTLDLARLSTG